jgi:predicted DNA-binding transcriptional regulator AlpA
MNDSHEEPTFPIDGPALYCTSAVTEKLSMSLSTLKRQVAAGRFPAPIKTSERAVRFRASDLRAWLATREAA